MSPQELADLQHALAAVWSGADRLDAEAVADQLAAGEVEERPADGGRARWVLQYRLTDAGRREYAAMFGGQS